MLRPQSQQLPLMQNGGTEVLNHSYAEENAENTALPKSHDHDNDNDDAEDSTLPGDASDGPTNSDFSSEFDDSYPTQLLNMANGNNADPFLVATTFQSLVAHTWPMERQILNFQLDDKPLRN